MRFDIFDFFSFDRGHNTTGHNYSCYVDGNHNANDNGTDLNDRTDNNNNDKFTWVIELYRNTMTHTIRHMNI